MREGERGRGERRVSISKIALTKTLLLLIIEGRGVVLPALDLESRNVEVLAVVADAEESLRDDDKFESCDVLRVINHVECLLRLGSIIFMGIEQVWPWAWPVM